MQLHPVHGGILVFNASGILYQDPGGTKERPADADPRVTFTYKKAYVLRTPLTPFPRRVHLAPTMSTFPDSDAVTVCAPDIITYRLKGKMVYVTPALNYEEAVANAREVFPELVGVDERRITFSVSVKLNNSEKDTAVIGPMAWGSLVQRLRLYEVVNIEISQPQAERGAAPMSQFGARLRAFVCGGKSGSGSQSAEGKSMGEGHSRWDDSESKAHRVSKV